MALGHDSTHLCSSAAQRQGRNFFIWRGYGDFSQINMSWRVDDENPFTVAKMYRWVDSVIAEATGTIPENPLYTFFPVDIKPVVRGILEYQMQHKSHPPISLARGSEEPLNPGDYGVFMPDGSEYQVEFMVISALDLWTDHQMVTLGRTRLASTPSTNLLDTVLERNKRKCLFTGTVLTQEQPDTVATWFIPPYCRFLTSFTNLNDREEMWVDVLKDNALCEKLETDDNCLVTSRHVAELLWKNKLAVDVEDNYRIIYFDQRTPDTPAFKSHLVFPNTENRLKDDSLRGHFRHSLRVNIIGGDIRGDFVLNAPEFFLEDRDFDAEENDKEEYDFMDEAWQTDLGKLVRSWMITYWHDDRL